MPQFIKNHSESILSKKNTKGASAVGSLIIYLSVQKKKERYFPCELQVMESIA